MQYVIQNIEDNCYYVRYSERISHISFGDIKYDFGWTSFKNHSKIFLFNTQQEANQIIKQMNKYYECDNYYIIVSI